MLDTDDSDSVSSTSTSRSENMLMSGADELQLDRESFLDQCVDALYEKRGSTREKALAAIIEAFNNNLQHEFVEKNRSATSRQSPFEPNDHHNDDRQTTITAMATIAPSSPISLRHQVQAIAISSIPWQPPIRLKLFPNTHYSTSHITTSAPHPQFYPPPISTSYGHGLGVGREWGLHGGGWAVMLVDLKKKRFGDWDCGSDHWSWGQSPRDIGRISPSYFTRSLNLVTGLFGYFTFVGGTEPEETEKSMQIMWQVVHPKRGSNVVTTKPSPAVITAMVSAWSLLLTTMDGRTLDPKTWQESISYFLTLLDKDDRSIRIAAGEALALIFEMGNLEKFCGEAKASSDSSDHEKNDSRNFAHIQGLRAKILNQVRNLSAEAGGRGSTKKDLNSQRNSFRDILDFLEGGYPPETSMKIGGESLTTTSWSQLIQLNFLKHFLGGGFVKHMQENEFLHDVFGFVPKRRQLFASEQKMSSNDKRLYKSPNSVANKARTQFRNRQRMLCQDRNTGHFAVGTGDDAVTTRWSKSQASDDILADVADYEPPHI
ncbi:interferon-related developmental regulator family protein [Actinidia rufa]|uniref:Interferon-related developmental regulator family protein n=1 Tax=Actinidia rufa TaxID=165716 RepID=A0A7J0DWL9_9ERIC|nr:interferon-related developmental regulator family protein [Actinidia rufa]